MPLTNPKVLVAATAAIAAVALTACGSGGGGTTAGSGNGSASSNKSLEVFSWWTSGSESAALKALVTTAETQDPGLKITNGAVAGGGGSNAQAVLQTRLQGGNPPDTWQSHPGAAIKQYIDAGALADLTSVYTDNKFTDAMPKVLTDASSADGKIYGISTGAHRGNVLWFNKKLLAKAGVATPTGSYTVQQFLSDLGTVKSKGISPLCVGAKDAFAPAELFENTLLGVTGAQGWDSLTTSTDKWNSDQVKQAATYFTQMLPYFDSDASASTWDQATGKLAAGKCAFESMGDWAYGELVKQGAKDGADFGYVPEPGTSGTFVLVVDTFVVAKNAKNKDAALKWAATIGSKEAQIAFNKLKGSTPIRTDVDMSSFPAYQQAAAKSFRGDTLVQSVVQGEAMNPQFQQSLDDAVTQLVSNKNVEAFVLALKNAASQG
jgi:glucose/mannose transport system substrate-binding protein